MIFLYPALTVCYPLLKTLLKKVLRQCTLDHLLFVRQTPKTILSFFLSRSFNNIENSNQGNIYFFLKEK